MISIRFIVIAFTVTVNTAVFPSYVTVTFLSPAEVVFSNGLNIDRAVEIHKYCAGRVQDSYGVGTFLTCDVTGCRPMNIVIKLTRGRITEQREWHDCVKLSCNTSKTLGNEDKCRYLISQLPK